MEPQNHKDWEDLVNDNWQIAMTIALRMWDLFYSSDSDTFRETLSLEESEIVFRSDLNHEERKERYIS
jgi:hypothetical protein